MRNQTPGGGGTRSGLHSLAWLVWLGASLGALSATRNPIYLIILLSCIAFVGVVVRFQAGPAATQVPVARMMVLIVLLSAAFNALISHYGDTVLFVIPGGIPLLSGIVTLESTLYGFLNGLVLAGFLNAFSILNQALPVRALVRWIPRAFYPVAVVVSIAITYVPTTLRQMSQIREAQTVRGHRWRGWRDWLALFMPLLVNGLERAMGLTEAMMARGFATGDEPDQRVLPRLVLGAGMVLLVGGWLMRVVGWGTEWGLSLIMLGLVAVLAMLWQTGRRVPRTTYRQERWSGRDWLALLGAVVAGLFFLVPIPGMDRLTLAYYPYPAITLPGFDSRIGLAGLGLLAPGIALLWGHLRRKGA
jgi:energy-coupling factor transport system permease protein